MRWSLWPAVRLVLSSTTNSEVAVKRIEIWVVTLLFLAMISIPVIAFAAGVRPEPNQNRPPTPLPEFNVADILNRELTPQLDAYLQDALIIAPGAVAAQAWADVALGDSPSEKVTLGDAGWLYYTQSVAQPCFAPTETADYLDTVERAQRIVSATGRELIVAVAPDKGSIIPDFLADEESRCVLGNADLLEDIDAPDWYVTAWRDMRRARANERPIYYRLDTHWTNAGAAVMAEAIVETVVPGSWNDDAVRQIGTRDHEGDLTVLLGLPATEPVDELTVVLPGKQATQAGRKLVDPAGTEVAGVSALDFTVTGDPVIGGHTVVMHDSFGWAMVRMIAPYFETASFVAQTNPQTGYMQTELETADTIVHMTVQRSLRGVVINPDLGTQFAAAFADSFEHTDVGQLGAGAEALLGQSIGANSDTYVVVELAEGTASAELSLGDTTATITADSPRTAFHIDAASALTTSAPVEYYLITIDR